MNRYEIIRELGKGSYGSVKLARDVATKELYAIKKVKLSCLSKKEREKALGEVKVLSSIKHPNVVAYKDSFTENSTLYIVMEYIDGGDLDKVISNQKNKLMTEVEILRYFVQIVSVVAHLHSQHILHRDLKPQNVFLTKLGIVKLGDFGVAKSLDSSCDLAKTVIGTPFYLSPEIWEGSPYDQKSDIWSLGCILFELCSLHKPFEAQSASALLAAVIQGKHGAIPSRYSQSLKDLIDGMLNLAPQLRPTAQQIAELPFIKKAMTDLINRNQKTLQQSTTPPRQKSTKKTRPRILFTAQNQAPTLKFSPPPQKQIEPPKSQQNAKRTSTSSRDVPKWAFSKTSSKRVQPTFGAQPSFKEDFISEDEFEETNEKNEYEDPQIEDDFIEDDDFIDDQNDDEKNESDFESDEFHILEETTASLRDSLISSGDAPPSWTYKPSPAKASNKMNNFTSLNSINNEINTGNNDNNNTNMITFGKVDTYEIGKLRSRLEDEMGDAQFALLYAHVLTENIPSSAKFIRDYEEKNEDAVVLVRDLIRMERSVD